MEYKGIKDLEITEISGKSIDINDGFVELWHSMIRIDVTKEQALATAKLIEQAPKMLAEHQMDLKHLLTWEKQLSDAGLKGSTMYVEYQDMIEAKREVIKNATK